MMYLYINTVHTIGTKADMEKLQDSIEMDDEEGGTSGHEIGMTIIHIVHACATCICQYLSMYERNAEPNV